MNEQTTLVDFVTRNPSLDEWKMVLVEEGPWGRPLDRQLRRLQERLYGCVDAALDGKFAEQFPDSKGKRVVVRLDCYNLPRDEVEAFFNRFSTGVMSLADYREALDGSTFVSELAFEINFD